MCLGEKSAVSFSSQRPDFFGGSARTSQVESLQVGARVRIKWESVTKVCHLVSYKALSSRKEFYSFSWRPLEDVEAFGRAL